MDPTPITGEDQPSSALLFLAGKGQAGAGAASAPATVPQAVLSSLKIADEITELKNALKWTQDKLRSVTTSWNLCEREKTDALKRVAELEGGQHSRGGGGVHRNESVGLSQQLEALANALHSASAEVEANDIELTLERRRRIAAKNMADALLKRLSSENDTADAGLAAFDDIAIERPRFSAHTTTHTTVASERPVRQPAERKLPRTSATTVDKAIEHLKKRFQQMNVTVPFVREDDFTYRLGNERLYIQVQNGKLVLRLGGKYSDLLQWLESRF